MFGFGSSQRSTKLAREKAAKQEILSRHKANLAAERPPLVGDQPPSRKKIGFGRRVRYPW
jgi:hypothetical protein